MADRRTIARPYARAAFEEARADKRLADWSKAINTGAAVVQDERMQNLLGDPHVTPQQLADMVVFAASPRAKTISGQAISVCGDTNMLG